MWLLPNSKLEDSILGSLAQCASRYHAKIYAFAISGNHLHAAALYPRANRAHFQRDLNSAVARSVQRHVSEFSGGRLWGRRYSSEFIPENEDIENYFFYIVLQAVQDGLVDKISDYRGYNCFSDAVNGTKRKFKIINWGAYHDRRRWDPSASVKDFTEVIEFSFERLPGYEHLTQAEYKQLMHKKLEARRLQVLKRRGKPSLGAEKLGSMVPGTIPRKTKTNSRYGNRPRILCSDPQKHREHMCWYFDVYWAYKKASLRYRQGDLDVRFPDGTYKPPIYTVYNSSG